MHAARDPAGRGPKISAVTASLWILLGLSVAASLFESAVLPGEWTSLRYASAFFKMDALDDSWMPMRAAYQWMQSHPGQPVYPEIFFREHVKYQYPPSSLLIVAASEHLPLARLHPIAFLNLASWILMLATALLAAAIFRESIIQTAATELLPRSRIDDLARSAAVVLLALMFFPLTRGYRLGQVQTLLTFLAGVSIFAWQKGRKILAGVCIGLACAVKPQFAVLVAWGLIRRQFAFAAAETLTAAGMVAVSAIAWGVRNYVDYFSVLSTLSRHGESYFANQSVNGLAHRLAFNGNNMRWVEDSLPPFHPAVYAATLASAVILLAAALLWRARTRDGPNALDLSIGILSATMAAPIAWEHHYGVLVPILALLAPAVLARPALGGLTPWLLGVATFFASQPLTLTGRFAGSRLNVLQSFLLFAAMMVLVLLYLASSRPGPSPGAPPTRAAA